MKKGGKKGRVVVIMIGFSVESLIWAHENVAHQDVKSSKRPCFSDAAVHIQRGLLDYLGQSDANSLSVTNRLQRAENEKRFDPVNFPKEGIKPIQALQIVGELFSPNALEAFPALLNVSRISQDPLARAKEQLRMLAAELPPNTIPHQFIYGLYRYLGGASLHDLNLTIQSYKQLKSPYADELLAWCDIYGLGAPQPPDWDKAQARANSLPHFWAEKSLSKFAPFFTRAADRIEYVRLGHFVEDQEERVAGEEGDGWAQFYIDDADQCRKVLTQFKNLAEHPLATLWDYRAVFRSLDSVTRSIDASGEHDRFMVSALLAVSQKILNHPEHSAADAAAVAATFLENHNRDEDDLPPLFDDNVHDQGIKILEGIVDLPDHTTGNLEDLASAYDDPNRAVTMLEKNRQKFGDSLVRFRLLGNYHRKAGAY